MSGIWLPDGCKLAINLEKGNGFTIYQHDVIVIFFWCCRVSLNKFSYWPKFYVNIKTGSGVMRIFVYKGLTRNPKIGNTPLWFFPSIWRLGLVRDAKFGMNVSNKKLLNAAKCQSYSFYHFWVIKEKVHTPRLGLNHVIKRNSSIYMYFQNKVKWRRMR